MKDVNSKPLKLTYYTDGNIEITRDFTPFHNRKVFKRVLTSGYKYTASRLSRRNYIRQYKNFFARIKHRNIDPEKCLFVTLTSAEPITPKAILKRFETFIKTLRNHYGQVGYARCVEFHEDHLRCHIHVLLLFEKREYISNSGLERVWKIGICHISNFNEKDLINLGKQKLVFDAIGALNYMSIYKQNNVEKQLAKDYKTGKIYEIESRYTYFPKKFRIFAMSRNFGCDNNFETKQFQISIEQANNVYKWARGGIDNYTRKDCHSHIGNGASGLYIDKLHIRNVSDKQFEELKVLLDL